MQKILCSNFYLHFHVHIFSTGKILMEFIIFLKNKQKFYFILTKDEKILKNCYNEDFNNY